MTTADYGQTVNPVLTFEQRPCVVGRVAALRGGLLIDCYAYILGVVVRLLVHTRTVRVIRISYPCVISFSVSSSDTGNALFSLYFTPCIIGRIVALRCARFVIGESDIRLPCRIIADAIPVGIIGVPDPCIVGCPILPRCSRNTLRTCGARSTFRYLFQPCRIIF